MMTIAAVTATPAHEAAWTSVLHWAGEILPVAGIILAAKGISDVRRNWTLLPGTWGRTRQVIRNNWDRATGLMWAGWNRLADRDWVARHLHLRRHEGKSAVATPNAVMGEVSIGATAMAGPGHPPSQGTDERLAWLESQMMATSKQITALTAWRHQEIMARDAATEDERTARMAEDQRIRELMADLAAGGLRLQAWGVACTLAGTILTACW